jgi:hypothetical protein
MTESSLRGAEPSSNEASKRTHCANCGAAITGNFCAQCGQGTEDYRLSVRLLMKEAAEDSLDLNGKIFKTLRLLFFKPGHLTNEYLAGKRVSYARPFRLYLTASVLFFLIFASRPDAQVFAFNENQKVSLRSSSASTDAGVAPDALSRPTAGGELPTAGSVDAGVAAAQEARVPDAGVLAEPVMTDAELEKELKRVYAKVVPGQSLEASQADFVKLAKQLRARAGLSEEAKVVVDVARALESGDSEAAQRIAMGRLAAELEAESDGSAKHIARQLRKLHVMSRAEIARAAKEQFSVYMPRVMFVLLPLFAFLLKLLYVRSGRLYVDHFIFALHVHALAFFVFALQLLLHSVPYEDQISSWLDLAVFVYLLLAMRRVYRQGWLKTVLKSGLVLVGYGMALIFATVGIFGAAFWWA